MVTASCPVLAPLERLWNHSLGSCKIFICINKIASLTSPEQPCPDLAVSPHERNAPDSSWSLWPLKTALSLSSRSVFYSWGVPHTFLSPGTEFFCMCMPILAGLLHPVLLSCVFAPSLRLPVLWSCPDPAHSQNRESLGVDVTDSRVGLVYVHFWGPWRRKLTQERGAVRLSYLCKASALLTNELLCCLQNTGDFWGPSCSARVLINNKCLSPPAWSNCTPVYTRTFQHHPAPAGARNNTFLRPGAQAAASSGDLPHGLNAVLILSRLLIFQGESCNELWELRRRVVEQNECARGVFGVSFRLMQSLKIKPLQQKDNTASLSLPPH